MPNLCCICTHANRLGIDRAIVEGKNLTQLAKDYDVPYHALYAHSQKHISRQLATVMEKRVMIEGNELMETINKIIQRAEDIFTRNYNAKKDITALKALDSQRNTIQLLNNISAQLHAAKIAELQLKKDQSGESKEELEIKYQKKLSYLSFDELQVYQRLINKMLEQNDDTIIYNNRVSPKKQETRLKL